MPHTATFRFCLKSERNVLCLKIDLRFCIAYSFHVIVLDLCSIKTRVVSTDSDM